MKKVLMLFTVVLVAMAGFTSCSDDDDKGGLSGWYAAQLPSKGSSDYTGKAYNFVSGNTVYYYNYISGTSYWSGMSEALTGPMSGYYVQSGCNETYTYEIIDNKVYIPMQGVILTIDGNSLRRDGSSLVFTKR